MSIDLFFKALTAVALVAIAVFEVVQLVRRPHDRALRALVPGIVLLAVVVTLGVPVALLKPIDAALDSIQFSSLAWLSMAYCYAVFFLLADERRPVRRKVGLEFLALLVAIALMYWTSAGDGLSAPGEPRGWRDVVNALGSDGYCVVVWGLGTVRAVRYWRRLAHPWAKVALALVIVGTAAMALGVDGVNLVRQGLYLVYPGTTYPHLKTVYNTGRLGGQILLAVGLAAAPLAGLVVRLRARYDRVQRDRWRREMAPLWSRLVAVFPVVVLDAGDGSPSVTTPPRGFQRTTSEISDALAHLAAYRPEGADAAPRDPTAVADAVVTALERVAAERDARWAGEAPVRGEPPFPPLEPDFGDRWRDRARWMVALSRELERRRPAVAPDSREGERVIARG